MFALLPLSFKSCMGPRVQTPSEGPRRARKVKTLPDLHAVVDRNPARSLDFHAIRFRIQACSEGDSQQNLTYRPRRTQGMRSSFGVRARVRFRTQESGTWSRRASSAESMSETGAKLGVWDTVGTFAHVTATLSMVCIRTEVP
jgi:hypothetical protein